MRTFYNASDELLFSLYCSMLMFLIGIENENWLNEITSVIHATLGMGMERGAAADGSVCR